MRASESVKRARQGFKFGLNSLYQDVILGARGQFIIEVKDARTGEILDRRELDNIITRDGGVLAAMLFAAGPTGTSGLIMLGVGTGATGPILNPDAPDPRQRHLNAEIQRKPFSNTTFRTQSGAVSAVPTNIVDFTTIYAEAEAVGPLDEMGLMRTISLNPLVQNPVPSVFPTYDPTIDLTLFDIMVNYLTFPVVSKPNTSILTVTWRLTF